MSAEEFTRDHVQISLGKILQTLGWNSINSSPLEILTDIMAHFMKNLSRTTVNYANHAGRNDPMLKDLVLAFRQMNIQITDLAEFVTYVNFGPPPAQVPNYPLPQENHLNFLKPGSREVVTRPVHIHEHLPPMYPLLEGNDTDGEPARVEEPGEASPENGQGFKKLSDLQHPEFKKPRKSSTSSFRREEEGSRPTREISSVMMTTSGFLSPAREGKLPEARTPVTTAEMVNPPTPVPEPVDVTPKKPQTKTTKKTVERKRARPAGPLMSFGIPADGIIAVEKKRKINWALKSKMVETAMFHVPPGTDISKVPTPPNKARQVNRMNKALAAARLKTEKLNTTITPITIKPISNMPGPSHESDYSDKFVDKLVDKLFTEPDKKKVNIFKKISNVKNEKLEGKGRRDELGSRETSPLLIIDEPDEIVAKLSHLSGDVTIEPINPPMMMKSPEKIDTSLFFDDDSQPGTPSTPKTPEMISQSPPMMVKERRKRKDSRRVKKLQKHQSPHRLDNEIIVDMERPKTPEAQGLPKMEVPLPTMAQLGHGGPMPFPFIASFGGPGLIPAPLRTPLFPPMNFPSHLSATPINVPGPHFGEKPFMSLPGPSTSISPIPPYTPLPSPKIEDGQPKSSPPNIKIPATVTAPVDSPTPTLKQEKKIKEHKKEKKDKLKKRNKKDKIKDKAEKKKLKEKIKKERREKRKEKEMLEADSSTLKITLKLDNAASPGPEAIEPRKVIIKPVVKKEGEMTVEERKRETSPGLAKIAALVCGPPKPKAPTSNEPAEDFLNEEAPVAPAPRTGPGPGRPRIHPIKPKPAASKPKKRRSPVKKDSEGNEVWICPGCGRQDDGSPMIGCDGCDAWYHWVCVGIQVPPDDNENWYCRHCLLKKNEDLQSDKQKKKRKKREKKEAM